jgi:Icc protein
MTVIAHLSDLHLIERQHQKRSSLSRTRLSLLSAFAPLDAEIRVKQAIETLRACVRAGADHVVITGDLTEDGSAAQFEVLAEVLDASGLDPDRVTIVPGNHDGYGLTGTFERALNGPLAAYKPSSEARSAVVRGDVVLQPISTMIDGQSITQAGGALRAEDVAAIASLASDSVCRNRTFVVAQHHPPLASAWPGLSIFHRVDNVVAQSELLRDRARVHVLHGHVHKPVTRTLCGREHAQVYSTGSVRDGGTTLRLYKAEEGTLRELTLPTPATVAVSRPEPVLSHGRAALAV